MNLWYPHKHDAQIAVLIETPPDETVAQQRARCAKYAELVAERTHDLGHDAYAMAISNASRGEGGKLRLPQ